MSTWFKCLSLATALLSLIVVIAGAYVRLTNAGLGCPDWPGCYGHLIVPQPDNQDVQATFPQISIETGKAWNEMIHRYLAGILGLFILLLCILAWFNRRAFNQPLLLPFLLLGLVIIQTLFGMWTVTLLLHPVIVTIHLLLGMATMALLWLLVFNQWRRLAAGYSIRRIINMKSWALGVLLLVIIQIALGGWISANYAALYCPDFPTCQGQWWPPTDFTGAFNFTHELGVNYEGGHLTKDQGVTIHLAHRLGALAVTIYVVLLLIVGWRRLVRDLFPTLTTISALLLIQICLGIANVLLALPLAVAVAHNAAAALLLIAVTYLNHRVRCPRCPAA